MHHALFGTIDWQAGIGWWAGRVVIPFFSGYDTAATAACAGRLGVADWQKAPDNRYQRGDFDLYVICPDGSRPSVAQEQAFRHFLDNQGALCSLVVDAIFERYQGEWGSWRETAAPGKEYEYADDLRVPELMSPADLRRVIRLESLTLLDGAKNEPAIVGFCFECSWDVEHGFGVLVRAGKVIEIGENDITWSAPESAGRRGGMMAAPTQQQIEEQRGIAAIKKLGGTETLERVDPSAPCFVAQVNLCRNTRITDADLQALGYFRDLRQLELASPMITDAGLRVLRGLKNLRTLQLSGTGITDAGLPALHDLMDLKVLHLAGTAISDIGLKELGEFLKLTLLNLSGTKITDRGLKKLGGCKALVALHLNDTNVSDTGLKELRALGALQHLELANTRVTDAGIRELTDLRGLLTLDLQGTLITDAGLLDLQPFTSLRYLTLSRTNVADQGLHHLHSLKSLRTLKLQSTATTDAGIADLKRELPRLQVVR